ncbi:Sterol 24-C-methyltransferase erg-4 [Neolecta irregularis DAH-3]|uniref:Sterol 24-C-methyltransferase n=1 Tax=Neolecta irregularis (strain DAH-3) TaxID=1198029 RepID=A0A1U7LHY9_NEOID|nr:Sterol 24-C-methyltransferase erg-4 [Neolecta irregularis DAH-3]|eukprot:OLL22141.1 Sterol 24-C-methyltransferase erg-4 [Neolecta irregularis DAH-3]
MTTQFSQTYKKDHDFSKVLHGKNAADKEGFSAMFNKDSRAQQTVNSYFSFWDHKAPGQETDTDKKERLSNYSKLTNAYYNLSTDLYEYGWAQSFHFATYYPGESFFQALARHEHYLALKMNIQDNYNVLDVGCGVGGPAREICTFTNANITGLNNNDYQIERARNYTTRRGLSEKIRFVKGDFMQMPFDDACFDAVYAIEATCHAPKLEGVYGEIYRVLKPGGIFGVYEWVMTDSYDASDPEQRKVAYGIEVGDGIPQMVTMSDARNALKKVGFGIILEDDLAAHGDVVPWYYPIAGQLKHVRSMGDFWKVFTMTKFARTSLNYMVGGLEMIGLAPKGTQRVGTNLAVAADALVTGGERNLFTPMMMFVCKKPKT